MTEIEEQAEELFSVLFRLRNHKLSPKPINGIRPGEMMLLFQLFEHPLQRDEAGKGMTVSELSAAFGTSAAAITQHVNPLERSGYLTRESDPADRRVVRVRLTEKGRRQMDETREHILHDVYSMAAFLGPRDTEDLIRILRRIQTYREHTQDSESCRRR